jgi:hypothetical protein
MGRPILNHEAALWPDGQPRRRIRFYAHKLVKEVAEGIANEMYEMLAKDNNWAKLNPELRAGRGHEVARRAFVRRNTGRFLQQARHTLGQLLSTNIPENLKAEILDALIKDNELRYGRESAAFQI